jgi:hypothetical protein
MLNITQIIGIVLAVVAFSAGTWLGHSTTVARAVRAENNLAQLKQAGDMSKIHYDRETQILRAQVKTIQTQGWEALANSAKNFEEYKAQQTKNLAKKDTEIASLKILISGRESDLVRLRGDLALAKTDKEKAEIQARILAEEKALLESRNRQAGLECLEVPVPNEYLSNLNGV